jgi:hypothetical protein
VLHMDVAKVDRDVACYNGYTRMLQAFVRNVSFVFQTYVASVLSTYCICFTQMLQVFIRSVSSILDVCYKCFIWMLHMFHTDVARVCSKCFICFRCML